MARSNQLLSVVVPCYNEGKGIQLFYSELKSVLKTLADLDHQILFVDDGSRDDTLVRLNEIAREDSVVRIYSLSRNFGHQIALTAGLDAARGDAIITMDADLQHPPSLIPELVRHWRDGNDVVSAVRKTTADSTVFKRFSSRLFYRVINFLSEIPIVDGAADFCLLSAKAHAALNKMPERHRFLRGMVSWIGFQRAFVPFEAPARAAGTSNYTVRKMIGLALNAVFSFSTLPIRLATQLGFTAIFLSLLYLAYILFCYFFRKDLMPGWASIIFVITFFGGVQLAFVGLLGEYIGRIFDEVKQRPIYLFKQTPADESRDEKRSDALPLL